MAKIKIKYFTISLVLLLIGCSVSDVSDYCVGFNPSTFWAVGNSSYATEENSSEENIEIQFLSFELVPKNKKGEKQYYSTGLMELVEKTKLYKK